jgi:hypothetical protein
VKVVRIATCEEEETLLERMAAAEPASEGGEIRAAATTPERRAEMAKKAAAKRTAKTQDTHKFQTRLGSGKRKAPPSRAELWAKPDENAAQGACLSTMHQGDESSVKNICAVVDTRSLQWPSNLRENVCSRFWIDAQK